MDISPPKQLGANDPTEHAAEAVRACAESTSVGDVMGRSVVCVKPESRLEEVADLFLFQDISSAPVVDAEGRPQGMVTMTDLLRVVFDAQASDSGRVSVRTIGEIATPFVLSLQEDAPISVAAALMAYEKIHRVPVLDPTGIVVGVIGAPEIVRWVADNAQKPASA